MRDIKLVDQLQKRVEIVDIFREVYQNAQVVYSCTSLLELYIDIFDTYVLCMYISFMFDLFHL